MEDSTVVAFFLENGPLYGTLIVGFLSGFVPIFNIELYLIALISLTSEPLGHLWLISLLASIGQTCSKTMIYAASLKAINMQMPAKLNATKVKSFSERFMNKGLKSDFMMACSSFIGFPPALLTTFVAGFARYPLFNFVAITFAGRWARFYLCLLFPDLIRNPPWR